MKGRELPRTEHTCFFHPTILSAVFQEYGEERHTTRLATLITVGFAEELLVLARLVISRQFNSTPRSGIKADGKLPHIIPYSSGAYPIIASLSIMSVWKPQMTDLPSRPSNSQVLHTSKPCSQKRQSLISTTDSGSD
jgi:hypothetical protein